MRKSLTSFLIALALLCGCATSRRSESVTSRVPAKLIHQIKDLLPEGWDVFVRRHSVSITRSEPISAYNLGPSAPLGTEHEYWIWISVADYVNPSEYPEVYRRNEELKEECLALFRAKFHKMQHRLPAKTPSDHVWEYDFWPRTRDEKDFVKKVRGIIGRLPSYYRGRHAYHIYSGIYEFKKDDQAEECVGVLRDIEELFGSYWRNEQHRTK